MSNVNTHRLPHGDIMVVEDDTSALKFLTEILTKAGYRVRPATDGGLALRSVRAKLPDLIVLDIKLPGMSGVEVCRHLKKDPETRDVPVIFVSALGETDLKVKALDAGGTDYVTKPIDPSEVLARINTHLTMYRLQRSLAVQAEELIAEIEHRKRVEEKLKEEKEFTEKALNTQLDTFFAFNPVTGKAIRWNKAFEEISGYSSEEIAQMKVPGPYYGQQDLAKIAEATAVILENGSGTIELEFICKNGRKIPFEYVASAIYNDLGQPENFISIGRNITDRKIIEEALRESEAQKRAILDASIDRLRYVDKDMKIIWGNKANVLELDMPLEDLVGQTCYEVFVGRNTPCEGCPTVRARETGKIERVVMHQPKVKGIEGESYWDVYCVPLKNEAGEIESFIQIARNISDQKKALEHIHGLTQQLMKAQEDERQMISRELHDRVGQDLSTLRIGLDTLIDNQPEVQPETRQRISELSKMLQDSIMVIRDLSYDLRPPSLDQLGLVRTILEYAHEFSEKTGLSVDVTSAGMDRLKLDSVVEINLYRLIQEGLNNISKHARANSATIRLIASFPNIILRIEDDGEGFDVKNRLVAAQNEKRMGLGNMRERVNLLNGAMTLKSRPGKGTRILIEVPYEEKKSESKKKHIDH